MSLTDLKKSKDDKHKKKAFTVDEFIADAENYAKGAPELVSKGKKQPVDLAQALAAAKQFEVKRQAERRKSKSDKPFRHATFTLSEEAIAQLQELAKDSQLAKSHIIRILINELCNKEQQEKLSKLLASNVD
ncbi:replication protein RepA [Thalassotalea insulae]|uniref:Replication protein RepA n=2 Tax=Thalassotalea insulae TaxID=2056778 RepID=A0ABQ6GRQ7_9GAMM|nr:replication protein RepA [Thalassotalea insulae]